MSDDRRRSARVEIVGRIHGHAVSLDVQVEVKEISLGGMALITPFPFPVGAHHEFLLTLGDGSTVYLRGNVVHCRNVAPPTDPETFVTGFRFVDEEEAQNDHVENLIEKMQ